MLTIDRDFILSRLTGQRGEKARLAEAMGIDGQKLSKILKGEREVQASEVPGLMAFFGMTLSGDDDSPPPRGFSESQAEPFRGATAGASAMRDGFSQWAEAGRRAMTYRMTAMVTGFGLLSGDILSVDPDRAPSSGDIVLVTIADPDHGGAQTVVRRVIGNHLISDDPGAAPMPMHGSNQSFAIMGTVRATARKY